MTRILGTARGAIAAALWKTAFASAVIGLGLAGAAAGPGALDVSFGTGGKVTTDLNGLNNLNDVTWGVAVQTDGMIVVSGSVGSGSTEDFAVARYHVNGTLDTSFGSGGKLTTAVGSVQDRGRAGLVVQTDGKIVQGGYSFSGSVSSFALVRYTGAGALDPGFGTGGKVTTTVGNSSAGYCMALQTDGKIVMAGYTGTSGSYDFALARFNPNGGLDPGFGTAGKVITSIGGDDLALDVTVQSDGKIVVVGQSWSGGNADFCVVRYNSDGSLDTSFDTDGKVTTAIGSTGDFAAAVTMLADGRIVVAGQTYNGSRYDFAVVRYLADGSLDTTFGAGTGKVVTPISGSDNSEGVVVLGNGKIVVAGDFHNGSNFDFAVARYNADGTMDTSFDGDGIAVTPIGSSYDIAQAVALQGDGGIVVAGYSDNVVTTDFALVRYLGDAVVNAPEIHVTGNGTLVLDGDAAPRLADHTDFGSVVANGATRSRTFTIHNTGSADLSVSSVGLSGTHAAEFTVGVLAPASPVPAGGSATFTVTFDPAALGLRTATVTVNSDDADEAAYGFALQGTGANPGALDTSFGLAGKVTTSMSGGDDFAWHVAMQPDGKIILAGNSHNGSNEDLAVARYNPDGTLDASFGTGGKVITTIGSSHEEGRGGVTVLADGKILVGLDYRNAPNNEFALVRYTSAGSLDPTFGGGDGKVTLLLGNSSDAYAMAVQTDGKIVLAGLTGSSGDYNVALARFQVDGSLDTSFGSSGTVITSIAADDIPFDMTVQADGKIVVAGYATGGGNTDFALVRYTSSGALDTGFDADGKVTTDIAGGNDSANGVVVLADGRILVSGYAVVGGQHDFSVARYLANGALDTSFGSGGKITTPVGAGADFGHKLVVQPDGRFAVCGGVNNGSNDDFAVVRFLADGTLDTSFGGTGKVITPIGSGQEVANDLALQADGGIVVAGFSHNGSNTDFALVRYLGETPVLAPEIHVTGNTIFIPDGDTTPSLTDTTDMGSTPTAGPTLARSYSIHNTGSADLIVSSIVPTGQPFDFIPGFPSEPIPPGELREFTITFDPTMDSLRTATITINSNDADEAAYDFVVQGTGLPNAAPTAVTDARTRPNTTRLVKAPVPELLANDTDPDLDALSLTAVGSALPPGSTVAIVGNFAVYTAPSETAGNGSFEYTVSDGHGHTATGYVTVTQTGPPAQDQPANAVRIAEDGDDYRIWFIGVPGRGYRVQWTADLTPPRIWHDFEPPPIFLAPPNGIFQHTDEEPPEDMRLYRAIPAEPAP